MSSKLSISDPVKREITIDIIHCLYPVSRSVHAIRWNIICAYLRQHILEQFLEDKKGIVNRIKLNTL